MDGFPMSLDTSKTRTHSLFRQGCMLYELIPTMPEHRLVPLMEKFAEAVATSRLFSTATVVAK
jgi:hypothetical protein